MRLPPVRTGFGGTAGGTCAAELVSGLGEGVFDEDDVGAGEAEAEAVSAAPVAGALRCGFGDTMGGGDAGVRESAKGEVEIGVTGEARGGVTASGSSTEAGLLGADLVGVACGTTGEEEAEEVDDVLRVDDEVKAPETAGGAEADTVISAAFAGSADTGGTGAGDGTAGVGVDRADGGCAGVSDAAVVGAVTATAGTAPGTASVTAVGGRAPDERGSARAEGRLRGVMASYSAAVAFGEGRVSAEAERETQRRRDAPRNSSASASALGIERTAYLRLLELLLALLCGNEIFEFFQAVNHCSAVSHSASSYGASTPGRFPG